MAAGALEERGRPHEAMEHWLRIADSTGFSALHPELRKDVIQRISSYRARLKVAVEEEVEEEHRREVRQLTERFDGIIVGMEADQRAEIERLTRSYESELATSQESLRAWRSQAAALTSLAADRLGSIEAQVSQLADESGSDSFGASDAWEVAQFVFSVVGLPRRGAFRLVRVLL